MMHLNGRHKKVTDAPARELLTSEKENDIIYYIRKEIFSREIANSHNKILPRGGLYRRERKCFMENYNAREGKPQPLRISPRAYALAVQYDVNLYQVKPTGPEGRIIERDIRAAIGIGE